MNERERTPREKWVRWIQENLFSAVVPHGWKKFKNGVKVSKLDYITEERAAKIVDFGGKAFQHYFNRLDAELESELLKLKESREALDDQLREAKKKWFNRKQCVEIAKQAHQVGAMAVGVNRALSLLRSVAPNLPDKPGEPAQEKTDTKGA